MLAQRELDVALDQELHLLLRVVEADFRQNDRQNAGDETHVRVLPLDQVPVVNHVDELLDLVVLEVDLRHALRRFLRDGVLLVLVD